MITQQKNNIKSKKIKAKENNVIKESVFDMCREYIERIKEKPLTKSMENAIDVAKNIVEILEIDELPVDVTHILTKLGFKIYKKIRAGKPTALAVG